MKKRILSVLLAVAMVGTMLVGCGSSKAANTKMQRQQSSREKSNHNWVYVITVISRCSYGYN